MNTTALKDIPESLRFYNQSRYKLELAQAVLRLMNRRKVKRGELAKLLDVEPSRVSHILSGDRNLGAETVADIFLVLGGASHLSLGMDAEEMRIAELEDPKANEEHHGEAHYERAAPVNIAAQRVHNGKRPDRLLGSTPNYLPCCSTRSNWTRGETPR